MSPRNAAGRVAAPDEEVTGEVTRLELMRAEAYLKRDIPALERLLSDNFTFNRAVGSFRKEELLGLIESGRLAFESLDRRVESVKMHLNRQRSMRACGAGRSSATATQPCWGCVRSGAASGR